MSNVNRIEVTELGVDEIGDGQQVVYSEVAVHPEGEGEPRIFLDVRERNRDTKTFGEGLLLPVKVWDAIVARVPEL